MNELLFFSGFLIFIMGILLFDLGVFNKNKHIISFKEAGIWTTVWVLLAMAFYVFLKTQGHLIHGINSIEELQSVIIKYHEIIKINSLSFNEAIKIYNNNLSLEFITGYIIEYSLSIDNVFVIILILTSFGIEKKYYKSVLFWGILGAIIMRFIFIFASSALIQRFNWILYIFGAFLVFTGVKMFLTRNKEEKIDSHHHPIVKLASKYFNVSTDGPKHKFFIKNNKKLFITPLFIVLLVIEFTDVLFAVDSVPAIFAVTRDPYIVFFSNIFAILGLRSLFFLIANIMGYFRFLKLGLAALLTFIGLKMLFHHWLDELNFTTAHSLIVIASIIGISIIASVIIPKKD